MKKTKTLEFGKAFHYPFERSKAMWNILWVLVPIYGWFALGGYTIRIINEFIKGKFKQLPKMHAWPDFKLGFVMFIKSIPFMFIYGLLSTLMDGSTWGWNPVWATTGGVANMFLGFFVIPILSINFIKKQTVSSYFEFNLLKVVFNNMSNYLVTLVKSIALGIVFLVMIIILVGLPAGQFTKNIFLADFYRRNVKQK
ncbi:MAG: DUF4013 domain-containing protein [Nanoarchaeota archaeon]|nr:DUF4013 domain-containing protein [Nanoarchaeota archaeon]